MIGLSFPTSEIDRVFKANPAALFWLVLLPQLATKTKTEGLSGSVTRVCGKIIRQWYLLNYCNLRGGTDRLWWKNTDRSNLKGKLWNSGVVKKVIKVSLLKLKVAQVQMWERPQYSPLCDMMNQSTLFLTHPTQSILQFFQPVLPQGAHNITYKIPLRFFALSYTQNQNSRPQTRSLNLTQVQR